MLNIKTFVFNPFQENTYVACDTESRDALVVDPGMINERECARINDYITDNKLKIKLIALTHMHLDHCVGANGMSRLYGAPIGASAADAFLGESIVGQATRFGLYLPESEGVRPEVDLTDGYEIRIGRYDFKVIAVPGHSPGGIALYCASEHVVFTGDSLFRSSIGRTDLPGGSTRQLVESVRDRLLTLPPETVVLPGHGPATTIGEELATNPFIM